MISFPILFLPLFACSDLSKPDYIDEGQEDDRPKLDVREDDVADNEPVEDDPEPIPEPEESEIEVCYLGLQLDNTQCFPTVDYDPIWGADYAYPEPYQDSEQYNRPIRFIDLEAVNSDSQLSPNFILDEVMSIEKGRFALFMPHLIESLQSIRDALGGPLSVTSAYRNVTYNEGVGGVTYSRHQYGDAVDLQTAMTDLDGLADECEFEGATFISVYESHVHCDWREDELEPAFYDPSPGEKNHTQRVDQKIIWSSTGWTTTTEGYDSQEGEPLRRWKARDANGFVLKSETSRFFLAPPLTHQIEVTIGRDELRLKDL